jgi:hypothetical protein
LFGVLFVYGIPVAGGVWLLVTIVRVKNQLDQIQARLDAISNRLDSPR